jgi:hypothetical protein
MESATPLAVHRRVDQHRQYAKRQIFPQAEVALAEQLADLQDERQDIKDHLLGELVGSGMRVLASHGRPWHHVTRDVIHGDHL